MTDTFRICPHSVANLAQGEAWGNSFLPAECRMADPLPHGTSGILPVTLAAYSTAFTKCTEDGVFKRNPLLK